MHAHAHTSIFQHHDYPHLCLLGNRAVALLLVISGCASRIAKVVLSRLDIIFSFLATVLCGSRQLICKKESWLLKEEENVDCRRPTLACQHGILLRMSWYAPGSATQNVIISHGSKGDVKSRYLSPNDYELRWCLLLHCNCKSVYGKKGHDLQLS